MAETEPDQDEENQGRWRAAAMKFVGLIQSGIPQRAENARSEVRLRIKRRHSGTPRRLNDIGEIGQ